MNKLLALAVVVGMSAFGYTLTHKNNTLHPTSNKDLGNVSATITNLAGNSGGSGVVLKSSPSVSYVLTNAHVCQVAKYGGMVTTPLGQGTVTSYRASKIHDLCLIETDVDLKVNTEVADNAPEEMDDAIVVGHPGLLPSIITKGNFSSKEVITVMTGMRSCTEDDYKNGLGIICAFLGGIPQITTYRSQVAATLISPGSSGSPVFNNKGKIAGLIFAGSGAINWGHLVPFEFVKNFVDTELPELVQVFPQTGGDISLGGNSRRLYDTCKDGKTNENFEIVKEYCKYVELDAIYQ